MKLVIIESPFAGETDRNIQYALRALADSIHRGESPYASHLLYPRVLDDAVTLERSHGIQLGYEWMRRADLVAVYQDYGLSHGMANAVHRASVLGLPLDYRSIGRNPEGGGRG